jgi:hypothetical protein
MHPELYLSDGEERFATLTGIKPAFGGVHTHGDTHNSLLSLGQNMYLEIIAPVPGQIPSDHTAKEKLRDFVPGLFAFAVNANDLHLVENLAKQAGLNISSSHQISRQSPSGEMLQWDSIFLGGHSFGHFIPFFLHFNGINHPSETSPKGCRLLEFSVGHPKHQELAHLYKILQINISVFESHYPKLNAKLSTPKGIITLNNHER